MKSPGMALLFVFFQAGALLCGAQNTGIGTLSPNSRLHINGTAWFQGDNTPLPANAGAGIGIGFGSGSTAGYIFAWNYTSYTPRNIWLQHTGGSVILGSASSTPVARLDISGNGMRAIYSATNSGEAFNGFSSGGHAIIGMSSSGLGVYAVSQVTGGAGSLAEGKYIGIQGTNTGTDVNRQGVRGENNGNAGGYAGLFNGGTTWVAGILQKNAGAFLIDHPLEPETKFLYHSFVESPDMKNIYDGVVTTDGSGNATVILPGWFQALNMDFRYQLTCLGQFAQAIVLNEISGNEFTIKTDKAFVKVSWQVTGTRNDPYARDKRIPVEKLKSNSETGKFIYPNGYGKSDDFLLDMLKPTNFSNSNGAASAAITK